MSLLDKMTDEQLQGILNENALLKKSVAKLGIKLLKLTAVLQRVVNVLIEIEE